MANYSIDELNIEGNQYKLNDNGLSQKISSSGMSAYYLIQQIQSTLDDLFEEAETKLSYLL